ncbi:MAG TPA: polyprenyl synthetase family protein [Acidimicrobiales bacterium]
MPAPNPLLGLDGMAALRDRIEQRIVAATETPDPELTEMTSHLVRAGGKRLRPVLAALTSIVGTGAKPDEEAGAGLSLDRVGDDAVTGGVACELVHVGSLHHDDVLDEATTRHNVPSVNARWGNLRAIISGDFLLARASELAASLGTDVAQLLAATIGRLCVGEVQELRVAYQVDRSEEAYTTAIAGKTAALYETACRIGAMVGGSPPEDIEAIGAYGLAYGMAFQVVDDVLDVVATDDELGKPAGHDMVEGVYNLPVLRALAGPDGDQLRGLLGGPLDDDARRKALDIVRAGPGVASAVATARAYVDEAIGALASLPPGPVVDALGDAARHLVAPFADQA